MKYQVTTGPNAYSFYDQSTGINIIRGEVKELTGAQYRTKRIQMAINSGHLMLVQEGAKVNKYDEKAIDRLYKKMKKQQSNGMEISKIAKAYSLEEAKLVAKSKGVEYDEKDTVQSILEVLLSDTEE
jgi:MoxR-like ATPase